MSNAVTQQQLDQTLKLFERLDKDEITFVELKAAVNNHVARVLAKQHMINFTFTEMMTGRFTVRRTGTYALTPFGKQRLAEIEGS